MWSLSKLNARLKFYQDPYGKANEASDTGLFLTKPLPHNYLQTRWETIFHFTSLTIKFTVNSIILLWSASIRIAYNVSCHSGSFEHLLQKCRKKSEIGSVVPTPGILLYTQLKPNKTFLFQALFEFNQPSLTLANQVRRSSKELLK